MLWGCIDETFEIWKGGFLAQVLKLESALPIRIGDRVRIERPDGSSLRAKVKNIDVKQVVREGQVVPNFVLTFVGRNLNRDAVPDKSQIYLLEKDENA